MMGGIVGILGTWPTCEGIWYDRPRTLPRRRGWGLKLALRWGPIIWPIPKFWSKMWNHDHYPTPEATWFTVRLRWVLGLYFSLCLGRVGMYIGLKDNGSTLLPSMKFEADRDGYNK